MPNLAGLAEGHRNGYSFSDWRFLSCFSDALFTTGAKKQTDIQFVASEKADLFSEVSNTSWVSIHENGRKSAISDWRWKIESLGRTNNHQQQTRRHFLTQSSFWHPKLGEQPKRILFWQDPRGSGCRTQDIRGQFPFESNVSWTSLFRPWAHACRHAPREIDFSRNRRLK